MRKAWRLLPASLLIGWLGGCDTAEEEGGRGAEEQAPPVELVELVEAREQQTPPPLVPMNAWQGVREGYLPLHTAVGLAHMPYTVKDGRVWVGDDVVLGTLEQLEGSRERGVAFSDVWFPTGRIPWFNHDLNATGVSRVRTAAAYLNAHTPLTLVEVAEGSERALRMKMQGWPVTITGSGGITYGYWDENMPSPEIAYGSGEPELRTIFHELGHALGFPHEFQREDRDTYVDHIDEFEDPWNYARLDTVYWPDPSANLSPFDFASIMKSGYEPWVILKSAYEWGWPDYPGAPVDELSVHDINNIYRVYAKALAAHEAGDGFGLAVSTGDYDDDGYEDIAVGFRDYQSSGADVGKWKMFVYFFRGVATASGEGSISTRYMPWFTKSVGVVDSGNEKLALASGDFNGDGITDLAVGMPWYDGGKGQVKVLFVTTTPSDSAKSETEDDYAPWGHRGVEHELTLAPTDVGLNSLGAHRFGEALAAGQLSVRRGLSTTPAHDLLIGAPKAANNLLVIPRNGGAVAQVRGTDTASPASWTPNVISLTWSPTNATGVEFGATLAVMPYFCASSTDKNSYTDTFVVGAPGYSSDAGAVYVYGCTVNSTGVTSAPALLRTVPHSQAGARYGQAVQAFRTLTASGASTYADHYLVIGAPGYTGTDGLDSGIVYLDSFALDGTKTYVDSYRPGTRYGGDEFGYALAVQQMHSNAGSTFGGPDVQIAIGLPGTKVNGVKAGKVYVWRPWNADGTRNSTAQVIEAHYATSSSTTRFGETLATLRNLNGQGGFVAGAPNAMEADLVYVNGMPTISHVKAGSIDVLLNQSTVPGGYDWSTWRKHLSQESTGDKRPTNL